MIEMKEALELGMTEFQDDRHFCTECVGYKPNAYMGTCHKGKKQYPKILNRCNMYATKVLQQTENFWEIEEKPFWEI